jgi:hypothetical protein
LVDSESDGSTHFEFIHIRCYTRNTIFPVLSFSCTILLCRSLDFKDDPTRELTSLHPVVDALQVRERLNRDLSLDLASSSEVESLDCVLTVSDVRSNDAESLEDGPEDVRLDVGVRRESDGDEGAVGAEVLEGLVVGSSGGGSHDGGLGYTGSVRMM